MPLQVDTVRVTCQIAIPYKASLTHTIQICTIYGCGRYLGGDKVATCSGTTTMFARGAVHSSPEIRVSLALHLCLLFGYMDLLRHVRLPSRTGDAILDTTVKTLEASKDVITSAAPIPGLGVALNLTIEVLKKIQVRH